MTHLARMLKAGCTIIALAGTSMALEARERPLTLNEDREVTTSVSYADLNISSVEGRRELEQRVRRAVDRVCQEPNGRVPLKESIQFRACRKVATERANALIQALTEEAELAVR